MLLYPPCLAEEGAVDLVLFQEFCGKPGRGWAWGCSSPGLRDLIVPKQSPDHLFFNVLYNICLQPSYMLEYHWIFSLFPEDQLGVPPVCSGEVDSDPTYLSTIFPPACNKNCFKDSVDN